MNEQIEEGLLLAVPHDETGFARYDPRRQGRSWSAVLVAIASALAERLAGKLFDALFGGKSTPAVDAAYDALVDQIVEELAHLFKEILQEDRLTAARGSLRGIISSMQSYNASQLPEGERRAMLNGIARDLDAVAGEFDRLGVPAIPEWIIAAGFQLALLQEFIVLGDAGQRAVLVDRTRAHLDMMAKKFDEMHAWSTTRVKGPWLLETPGMHSKYYIWRYTVADEARHFVKEGGGGNGKRRVEAQMETARTNLWTELEARIVIPAGYTGMVWAQMAEGYKRDIR